MKEARKWKQMIRDHKKCLTVLEHTKEAYTEREE